MTRLYHKSTSTDIAMWANDPELEHAEHFNEPHGAGIVLGFLLGVVVLLGVGVVLAWALGAI